MNREVRGVHRAHRKRAGTKGRREDRVRWRERLGAFGSRVADFIAELLEGLAPSVSGEVMYGTLPCALSPVKATPV